MLRSKKLIELDVTFWEHELKTGEKPPTLSALAGVSMVLATCAGMRCHITRLRTLFRPLLSERSQSELTLVRAEFVQRFEVRGDACAAEHAPHVRGPCAVGGDDHAAILCHREAPVRAAEPSRASGPCSNAVRYSWTDFCSTISPRRQCWHASSYGSIIAAATMCRAKRYKTVPHLTGVPTSGTSSQEQAPAVRSQTLMLPAASPAVDGACQGSGVLF